MTPSRLSSSPADAGGRRTLIVTGGSRGIGAAVAQGAARRGYRVCVNYLSDAHTAQRVVDEIVSSGGDAFAWQANTADETAIAAMFDETARRYGPVTDLVNNAGVSGGSTRVAELDVAVLNQTFAVNVIGYFLCCREAVRRMSTQRGGAGGRIVNVSSVAATNGSAGRRVHYAASKGAINSMTVGLAHEVAREGIRVNAVSPGLVFTDFNEPGRVERLQDDVPIGRGASPDEIADAILWMLGDEAGYVLGTNLIVSGGR
ncbi:NAD(P)-dependent dehydrogenase (short-subunit alcohol dehydrogenase family) [Paraburkholderia caballeronis]|uniref:SDR family oxidoreductase n=1 Tax=Paraburkholderia caballeronis TaxID=416943 RepID=UPI00106705C1|nr:SDR family oxidoreductase [Paraburkholderia caballeronis]TDV35551.1 NAD(P)-dependent dehydrogenase (short-subunit alcohol dehydrogenase family) [Paraburkholderia caballeronis]